MVVNMNSEFAWFIRERMTQLSIGTYAEAEQRTGVSADYISKMVRGQRVPDDEIIIKLARGLECDEGELVLLAKKARAPEELKPYFDRPRPRHPRLREWLLQLNPRREEMEREFSRTEHHSVERMLLRILFNLGLKERAMARSRLLGMEGVFSLPLETEEGYQLFWKVVEEHPELLGEEGINPLREELREWSYLTETDTLLIRTADGEVKVFNLNLVEVTEMETAISEERASYEGLPSRYRLRKLSRLIPVISYADAGKGFNYTDQEFPPGVASEYVSRPFDLTDTSAYALRVKGDSMSPRLDENDIVIVSPAKEATNNNLAVVQTKSGEVYLKKVIFQGENVILQSINPSYPPISLKVEDIRFIHPVVWIKPRFGL
ncbi:hypothetical protein CEE39_05655 [bacterium (candidate division B38) B3_B38]|nr:MAG: hypothetical protein CEE39_05655 [bacterium (candidate division B38) B3_B38]